MVVHTEFAIRRKASTQLTASWSLVFGRNLMQLDSHSAPCRRPHLVEHISCSSLNLRAEIAMTNRV